MKYHGLEIDFAALGQVLLAVAAVISSIQGFRVRKPKNKDKRNGTL